MTSLYGLPVVRVSCTLAAIRPPPRRHLSSRRLLATSVDLLHPSLPLHATGKTAAVDGIPPEQEAYFPALLRRNLFFCSSIFPTRRSVVQLIILS